MTWSRGQEEVVTSCQIRKMQSATMSGRLWSQSIVWKTMQSSRTLWVRQRSEQLHKIKKSASTFHYTLKAFVWISGTHTVIRNDAMQHNSPERFATCPKQKYNHTTEAALLEPFFTDHLVLPILHMRNCSNTLESRTSSNAYIRTPTPWLQRLYIWQQEQSQKDSGIHAEEQLDLSQRRWELCETLRLRDAEIVWYLPFEECL